MNAEVRLDWSADPQFSVDATDNGLLVTAHPSLSHAQVEAACAELGDTGPIVLAAWRDAVGFSEDPPAR